MHPETNLSECGGADSILGYKKTHVLSRPTPPATTYSMSRGSLKAGGKCRQIEVSLYKKVGNTNSSAVTFLTSHL